MAYRERIWNEKFYSDKMCFTKLKKCNFMNKICSTFRTLLLKSKSSIFL